jgi:CRISPR-associated protein Csm3
MSKAERFFFSYQTLYSINLKVKLIEPLHVGSGKESVSPIEPDNPVLRDTRNEPIIPGSTLKGFFRSNFERFASSVYGVQIAEKLGQLAFGSKDDKNPRCSCMFFPDLHILDGVMPYTELRDHVYIDRSTGGVSNKYDLEVVRENNVFAGVINVRNIPPSHLSCLLPVVKLANIGLARLGGSKSRGYGQVRLEINDIIIRLIGRTKPIRNTISNDLGIFGSVTYTIEEGTNGFSVTEKYENGTLSFSFVASIDEKNKELFFSTLKIHNGEAFLESAASSFDKFVSSVRQ